ncbi:MAG: hypothetical protein FJ213_07635 [Ignavibacteria bacterium]|nr:hypothetical protein [Ignavibacteria bacterium]
MNKHKQKAIDFLDETETFIGKELTNGIEIQKILESIFKMGNNQLLEDLSFTSKYAIGLMSILNNFSNEVSEEYKSGIKKDFEEAVEKLKELIKNAISNFSSEEKASFEFRYLELTQTSFTKLISLIEDFSKIKLYLNSLKQKN